MIIQIIYYNIQQSVDNKMKSKMAFKKPSKINPLPSPKAANRYLNSPSPEKMKLQANSSYISKSKVRIKVSIFYELKKSPIR